MMHKILPLALLFAAAAALAEPGSVSRTTDLKAKPFLDSATIAKLAANSQVDIGKRQGAWAQVRTPSGATGWIKLLNLRSGTAGSGSALSGIGKIANVARTGSSGNTVTTGVKGLSAEQIKNARPDPQQVEKLNRQAVSSAEAQRFARAAQLQARDVPAIGPAEASSND